MTKKTISSNSTGIQADGDVNINYGLSVNEVEKLALIFLEQNFPKLREDAMKIAYENVKLFTDKFEKKIREDFDKINEEKFQSPDVQSSFNDIVIEVAKKGENSNIDLLINLLFEKVSDSVLSLQDLIITDVIKIVAKLTKKQINILSLQLIITEFNFHNFDSFNKYDGYCSLIQTILDFEDEVDWDVEYLIANNCLLMSPFKNSTLEILKRKHKKVLQDFQDEQIINDIKSTTVFINLFMKHNNINFLSIVDLSVYGKVIGSLNLINLTPGSANILSSIK